MSNFQRAGDAAETHLSGKRILSIYYRHKPGGLCKRLYMMFHALATAGGEVHYIAVEAYPLSHPQIVPHILWTPFQKKEGLLFWSYFLLTTPFYAFYVARKEDITLVSVFGGVYGFSAVFIKILLQIPLLIFVRADAQEIGRVLRRAPLSLFIERLFLKMAFSLSDQVVAVSRALKKTLVSDYGLSSDKISVLNNHIADDLSTASDRLKSRLSLGLDQYVFVVLTTAVLDARKNVALVIHAAHRLNKTAFFLIVGEGPERQHLERLANEHDGKAQFRFTGWQEDVSAYLKAADLFVLPSKHEGCSNALLEALSSGLPCLASDIDENREVLNAASLLFDPHDFASLSDKIKKIMIDPNYFEKIKLLSGDARRRWVFDWDRRIVKYHQHLFLSTNRSR